MQFCYTQLDKCFRNYNARRKMGDFGAVVRVHILLVMSVLPDRNATKTITNFQLKRTSLSSKLIKRVIN